MLTTLLVAVVSGGGLFKWLIAKGDRETQARFKKADERRDNFDLVFDTLQTQVEFLTDNHATIVTGLTDEISRYQTRIASYENRIASYGAKLRECEEGHKASDVAIGELRIRLSETEEKLAAANVVLEQLQSSMSGIHPEL